MPVVMPIVMAVVMVIVITTENVLTVVMAIVQIARTVVMVMSGQFSESNWLSWLLSWILGMPCDDSHGDCYDK